ncbi:MAG: SCO family protein [Massilia sp.]
MANSNSPIAATAVALLLVAVLGVTALYQATLGFRVVATEDARRLKIREQPLLLPAGPVLAGLRADGRVAIVTFFYSRCNTVCSSLGSTCQQLQSAIVARGAARQVRLLSLSFDGRDDSAALSAYAAHQHADSAVWQLAALPAPQQRRDLLDAFGIVVLPAPPGEFQHNAAFHVVDRTGHLRRIFDLAEADAALAYALTLATAP